jgi:hypothetical protein
MEAKKFTFYEDWDNEGSLTYRNARTLKLYKSLNEQRNAVDVHKFDCFFAFNAEQFYQGLASIRPLHQGEKIEGNRYGLCGTHDGIKRLLAYYDDINAQIKARCAPQEVYCYEYNNYECCLDSDGDLQAIRFIAALFGDTAAEKVERKRALIPINLIFNEAL